MRFHHILVLGSFSLVGFCLNAQAVLGARGMYGTSRFQCGLMFQADQILDPRFMPAREIPGFALGMLLGKTVLIAKGENRAQVSYSLGGLVSFHVNPGYWSGLDRSAAAPSSKTFGGIEHHNVVVMDASGFSTEVELKGAHLFVLRSDFGDYLEQIRGLKEIDGVRDAYIEERMKRAAWVRTHVRNVFSRPRAGLKGPLSDIPVGTIEVADSRDWGFYYEAVRELFREASGVPFGMGVNKKDWRMAESSIAYLGAPRDGTYLMSGVSFDGARIKIWGGTVLKVLRVETPSGQAFMYVDIKNQFGGDERARITGNSLLAEVLVRN